MVGGCAGQVKTLLVVDDQPCERRLVSHAFGSSYRVLEAEDFDSAVVLMKTEAVSLVLLDLHLPPDLASPREGLRIHHHVRERAPHVPVVVVTGNNDPLLRAVVLRTGAHEFLAKPLDVGRLVRVVHTLLGS